MHLGGLVMGLIKIRLGDYIERSTVNNSDLKYGIDFIAGVNNQGVFTVPKGNTEGVDLKPYKIVNNGAFVYNPTRLDLGSIAYRMEDLCIVSHLYMVFYLTEEGKKIIDPLWLFIYFRRSEFCREVTFRNFGSQRPEFNFSDMSDIIIHLPDIDIQRKFVAVYNAMLENQQSYERRLDDLKLVCDAYIEDLRRKMPCEAIGAYIEEFNQKNEIGLTLDSVRGIATSKEFIDTKANMDGVALDNYKIVEPGMIAFISDTSRRADKMSLALNQSEEAYLVSSISTVIKTNKNKLLSKYLYLFFCRTEFDRYARFHSWGSARETFSIDDMKGIAIPIPNLEIQKSIVEIYEAYRTRKEINEKLKAQIKDICPILIKGSIEEAKKTKEA